MKRLTVRPALFFRESPHGDSLVFAPPARAELVDCLHRAISESQTWGEFRRRMPKEEYGDLFADIFSADSNDLEEDDSLREPAGEEKFDAESVPGFTDGDYPPWIAAEQDLYLPPDVLSAFGHSESSVLNGLFWIIDPGKREQLLGALKAKGYGLTEREDLQFW